jgi:hypothetical protein
LARWLIGLAVFLVLLPAFTELVEDVFLERDFLGTNRSSGCLRMMG